VAWRQWPTRRRPTNFNNSNMQHAFCNMPFCDLCPPASRPADGLVGAVVPSTGRSTSRSAMDEWNDAFLADAVADLRRAAQPKQPQAGPHAAKVSRTKRLPAGAAPEPPRKQLRLHAPGLAPPVQRRAPPAPAMGSGGPGPVTGPGLPRQEPKKISVGTECSGLESVMVAMEKLGFAPRTELTFVCEKDPVARKFILAHQAPKHVYTDITKRPVAKMPTCDIYAAGFPCQPWSAIGLRQGVDDEQGRGRIFPYIQEYIRTKQPKSFLLENVQGLASATHRETFVQMLRSLRSDGHYHVTWRLVNTTDFGLPQNRPRIYIVGLHRAALRRGVDKFYWPRPVTPCKLESLLDHRALRWKPTAPGARKNLAKLLAEVRPKAAAEAMALDIFSSKPRAVVGKIPCLTRTRAGAGGFYITTVGGLLTTKEMLRLQGLPERFEDIAQGCGITHRQLRMMIGNAMSVNVLVALLRGILAAVDLSL